MEYKIGIYDINFTEIVNEQIAEEYRKEALEIIKGIIDDNLPNKTERLFELYVYHKEKNYGNVFCLALEKNYQDLTKLGYEISGDSFKPMYDIDSD